MTSGLTGTSSEKRFGKQKTGDRMKKFLIVGSGYIGKVIEDEIRKAGHAFTTFDNNLLGLQKPGKDEAGNETIMDDSLNENGPLSKFTNYDVMINTAAVVGDPACLVDTRFALQNNCVGTRNMVEKANRDGKRIIHLSTCSLYGAEKCTEENPLKEADHTFPIDFYGQTKFQQERFVTERAKLYTVFRLGTAYGQSPRMRYDLVIPTFTAKAVNEGKITVFGGDQWRPFIHIRDVARAVIWFSERGIGGIFNLASENLTIKQLAYLIKESLTETKVEINDMIQDPRNYIVSSDKVRRLNFEFKYDVKYGIKEMAEAKTIKEYDRAIYHNDKLATLKKMGIKI